LACAWDESVQLAIGGEWEGESFSLVIDEIGEVVWLDDEEMEEDPVTCDPLWVPVSRGVYRLDGRRLALMDIDHVLADGPNDDVAAAA
jgi:purine-binding chemotaxis protein CheW